MVEVRRGDELGEEYRRRIIDVLVRGFAEDFAFFSTDPQVLADAFEHMVLLERFYVALSDGEPAAIASVTEGAQECFAPRWAEFRRHLGQIHGTISLKRPGLGGGSRSWEDRIHVIVDEFGAAAVEAVSAGVEGSSRADGLGA